MILAWLIIIPLAGGILAWSAGRGNSVWPRIISLVSLLADLGLALMLLQAAPGQQAPPGAQPWLADLNIRWVPELGISLHLAIDGLSLLMVLLTIFLGLVSVACSWTEIRERTGFFHFNLLFVLAGVIGVFLSLDLFLLYFFWELMLVPMYFLIALWGHEKRGYASVKFFIFTQLSGLLMLLAILGLYFIHGRSTGTYTFDYTQLLGTAMGKYQSYWLMAGFFAAFAVKLPVVPFHSWLPDAHTEAPTAGSVILAGLLLKTGAYGFIRFMIPLFPEAALDLRLLGMALSVTGILYGAVMAFAQNDLKRLIAYTSISHMGFVMLGIFSWNALGLQGAVIGMLCHGFSTGALFVLAGMLQERLHTRMLSGMGGYWTTAPRMAGMALFFAIASLGMPGLGNFIGEFLVLFGAFRVNGMITVIAAAGLVVSAVYSLWIVQKAFHGPVKGSPKWADLSTREMAVLAFMAAAIIILGIYPQPVLDTSAPSLSGILSAPDSISRTFGETGR